ncbi:MAG: VCBS repeat-containing protein [Prolixibacteraceae bacterium]|nr:VCBS repeat-containing protein [Prolixibacteraceae bacterium]MBT6999786.1 VCBS repeat-containing protein [Prolixibacteraceae bacterium]MBT7395156.1 VCBS repeat-containing protein [Prolixibacteraceae bacterium]
MSPSKTNVDFVNQLTETEEFNIIKYLYFNNGAGVAAGDINNDGLTDLYFTSNQLPNKLYLNKGSFIFEDISEISGVEGEGDWTTGVTMADVNGDNLLDIYVCYVGNHKGLHGKNQLFINQGNNSFFDEAEEYGLDFQGFSTQAAFFDYDADGDLDMYLLNHSIHTSRSYGAIDLRHDWDVRAGDRLYRNDEVNGARFFSDVTKESGIYSSQIGYGLGVNINDINNDGFADIYVSNDFHENDYLYINNGNGTFSERLTEMLAHTSRSSMGNDVGDFNNDGLLDIVVLDMLPDEEKIRKQSGGEDDYELFQLKLNYGYSNQFVRNTLQLNMGAGKFSEIGRLAGIYSTDWSWSPLFCDVDNDGLKDLLITNGIYRRANDLDYVKFLTGGNRYFPEKDNSGVPDRVLYEKMPLYPNINYAFKNNGDLTFSNKAKEWGFNISSFSNGSTYADLDNDGDLDFIVNNINDPAFIYRNNSEKQSENHFLSVAFKGKGLNTRGIGARVTLFINGEKQLAEQFATRGFMSATSDVLHFGLGRKNLVDSLMVRWPDHSEQVLKNVVVDKKITLDARNAEKPLNRSNPNQKNTKLFVRTDIPGLQFLHKEDAYTDFNREHLIPRSFSAEGPALAVGDVNGDGLDDLFVGGAKGQSAMLFVQQSDGTFVSQNNPVFTSDRITEDIDASFFDADGDSDLDLYIVRGGNEALAGNALLADKILINDGNGEFNLCARGALPFMAYNGSCVRPGDFDGDGDLDLFVGSGSVPGAYGWSPDQFLLENNGIGFFKDVTDIRLNGPKNVGMVSDASWLDYDRDGDQDLILVGEWMKVRIYQNDNGHFTDATEVAGLNETAGWWNSIQVADIDSDGDLDFIGGNLGLNSLLTASTSEPVEMYLNDFDNSGSFDQVICSYQNGTSYPVASLDQMAKQIAGIEKKYPNYSDFGGKTANDIFGKDILNQSLVKRAELLKSCLFLNNGNGTFETNELPKLTQFSPVRDILVRDFNSDGTMDFVLVGNDYAVRPSYGRYDAGFGWSLLGKNGIEYNTLMPDDSGLVIKGDARKVLPIKIKGNDFLVVAVNNGDLQIFEINPQEYIPDQIKNQKE